MNETPHATFGDVDYDEEFETFFLEPLGHQVVIQELHEVHEETSTDAGIVLLAENDLLKDYIKAEVMAVGPGAIDKHGNFAELSLEPGDFVIVRRHAGVSLTEGQEEYKIISEGDALCRYHVPCDDDEIDEEETD